MTGSCCIHGRELLGNNCHDLLEGGFVSHEEIAYASEIVLKEHRPVCIHKDGVFLLDDVGGICQLTHELEQIDKLLQGESFEELIGAI